MEIRIPILLLRMAFMVSVGAFASSGLCKVTQQTVDEIRQLQSEHNYAQAQTLIQAALQDDPNDQRAKMYMGINQRDQHNYAQAEQTLKQAIALDPGTNYAALSTFQVAKVQRLAGKNNDAKVTIQAMKAEYPDSTWLSNALVLEAEINGTATTALQQKLARQNAADRLYAQIEDSKTTAGPEVTAATFKTLALGNTDLPMYFAAREAAAHQLTNTADTTVAISAFQSIINDLNTSAPNSRIVQTANARIAALHHRLQNREQSLEYYQQALNASANPEISENAALQSAAIAFELLQRKVERKEEIPQTDWEELRTMLHSVKEDAQSTQTKLLADLMELESLLWSKELSSAIPLGNAFIENYGTQLQYKQQLATGYVALARFAKESRRYDDAIRFCNEVFELYPTEDVIYENCDLVERTYYDLIESLYFKGQIFQADQKLAEFSNRFPQCGYIKSINQSKTMYEKYRNPVQPNPNMAKRTIKL